MLFGLNIVDWIIIALLIIFAFEGLNRGLIAEILDLIGFIIAFILSLTFFNIAGGLIESTFSLPHSLANILGFVAVWFLIETILFGLIHFLLLRLKFFRTLYIDKFHLAVIPAFLRGLILVSMILILVGIFPIQPRVKLAVQESKIGSQILTRTSQLEGPLNNVFGDFTNDSLTLLTIKPQTNETVNLGFNTSNFSPNEALEIQMIEKVNEERAKVGLKPLTFDSKLREVGRGHSADMFERGYFSHYSPEGESVADRADKKDIKYLVVGENLAYAPSLQLAHQGLMNSEGHRANILSSEYGKIGIGIQDGKGFGLMVTQVFSN